MSDDRGYDIIWAHGTKAGVSMGEAVGLTFMAGMQHGLVLAMRHPEYAQWLTSLLPDAQHRPLLEAIDELVSNHPTERSKG